MAPVSQAELLERFSKLGISVEKHDHAPVPTVEAMAQEMQRLGVAGVCTKNLFIKDKKNRLYIITAAPDTKVDLKVLSARLGMGKGGLRFAPEELLEPVLALAPGSVTPLALVQESAKGVVLLIDQKLRGPGQKLLVHPLANDSTVALGSDGLDALLKSLGRTPAYVDLEADPKIDRDNPPDLAVHVQEAAAVSAEELAAKANVDASVLAGGGAAAAAAAGGKKGKKGGAAAGGAKRQGGDSASMDVDALAAALTEKIAAAGADAGAGTEAARRLQADVVMHLNILRNAAYAAGYTAGTQRCLRTLDGSWA